MQLSCVIGLNNHADAIICLFRLEDGVILLAHGIKQLEFGIFYPKLTPYKYCFFKYIIIILNFKIFY